VEIPDYQPTFGLRDRNKRNGNCSLGRTTLSWSFIVLDRPRVPRWDGERSLKRGDQEQEEKDQHPKGAHPHAKPSRNPSANAVRELAVRWGKSRRGKEKRKLTVITTWTPGKNKEKSAVVTPNPGFWPRACPAVHTRHLQLG